MIILLIPYKPHRNNCSDAVICGIIEVNMLGRLFLKVFTSFSHMSRLVLECPTVWMEECFQSVKICVRFM